MKRLKKILPLLLCLSMITFAFTGCSKSASEIETQTQSDIREKDLESVETYTETNFVSVLTATTSDSLQYYLESGYTFMNPTFDNDFLTRWSYFEELHGSVTAAEVLDTSANSDYDGFECRILMTGEDEEQMTLTIVYNEQVVPTSTTLTEYTDDSTQTLGSKMIGALGNIIVGLLVVFLVLILLMFVISAFGLIGKAKPKEVAKPVEEKKVEKPVQTAPAVPVQQEEDSAELVAVIAAAIAAAEGTSPSGFVVRSIRRLDSNKWR